MTQNTVDPRDRSNLVFFLITVHAGGGLCGVLTAPLFAAASNPELDPNLGRVCSNVQMLIPYIPRTYTGKHMND